MFRATCAGRLRRCTRPTSQPGPAWLDLRQRAQSRRGPVCVRGCRSSAVNRLLLLLLLGLRRPRRLQTWPSRRPDCSRRVRRHQRTTRHPQRWTAASSRRRHPPRAALQQPASLRLPRPSRQHSTQTWVSQQQIELLVVQNAQQPIMTGPSSSEILHLQPVSFCLSIACNF
ncbi:hypothetical protein CAOG_009320 [Capsaspora owczarzaki ATCC 30864]|uniref:Uncharacterized protein n=1 Tax=Capsaspora owczarzaki (strain ATCC 30864) TaxID=595528 RepID=A0A0D2U1G1_CAPO3|nr:hypothetical protein CAOG_009320 [Capsaspora owczarzaki ATCC 30864]